MHQATLAHITKRAEQSNVTLDKLDLECHPDKETAVFITVIWSGAVDEEFHLDELYAVNVADWIAETCVTEAAADPDHPEWEVNVTRESFGTGETIYSVTDSTVDS